MLKGLLSVWHAIFPLPPTPEEIVKQRREQIAALSRDLDRLQRRRERQEEKWQRQLDAHLDGGNETKAKYVATLMARSQLHAQADLKLKLHVEALGEQVQQSHYHMLAQRAFVDVTKAVARFNHEVPNAKIALATVIYQRERMAQGLKMDMMTETIAEEEEDEDELADEAEAAAGESTTASTIFEAAQKRAQLRHEEQLRVEAVLKTKQAARARREGREAPAVADGEGGAGGSSVPWSPEEASASVVFTDPVDEELGRRLEALQADHGKR